MPEPAEQAASSVQALHERVHSINPFTKKEQFPHLSLTAYKVLTALSWLLVVVISTFYTFHAPHDDRTKQHTIWGQNRARHTPFALNSLITSIYWIVLYILQLNYARHLYSGVSETVSAAANVGAHFITHNLLFFGFIMLWTRAHFWLAELLLIINFFNLSAAYFRHPTTPRQIHIAVVSAPLAFNFVALYWCGAAMVNAHSLVARVFANIAIWGILVYGMFFLVAYKDYTMGFELSVLAAALGVGQFLTHAIAFQWIFAFIIMGLLFIFSVLVGMPGLLGKEPFKRGAVVSEDRERDPLLQDS